MRHALRETSMNCHALFLKSSLQILRIRGQFCLCNVRQVKRMRVLFIETDPNVRETLVEAFSQKGWQVFESQTLGEFRQVLAVQGAMLDLALIRRESTLGEPTLDLLKDIRNDPDTHDLPVIILSSSWSESEAAEHQASDLGAHAYLQVPLTSNWFNTVSGVMGDEDSVSTPAASIATDAPMEIEIQNEVPVFEDVFAAEGTGGEDSEFKLDAPFEHTAELPVDNPVASEEALPAFDFSSVDLASLPQMEPSQLGELPPTLEESGLGDNTPNDPEMEAEMPYLFGNEASKRPEDNRLYFGQPLGDAVVPGGMSDAPDEEVLKRYLMLREQDVSILSAKVKDLTAQHSQTAKDLSEAYKSQELLERDLKSKDEELNRVRIEFEVRLESLEQSKNALEFELQKKTDALKVLERRMREAVEETDRIREQVKLDIRKIRIRERELESKLEILRKDSEVLIYSRESKIIELKRKLDLMEYNFELLQEQLSKEKAYGVVLKERLEKAAQAMRVAEGVLDEEDSPRVRKI